MTQRKNVSTALVLAALAGCAATTAPMTGDLQRDLKHVDPRIRIDSAFAVVAEGRADLASALADNLEDRDGAVRMFSAVALRKLTGQDFGYQAHNSPETRREAISRWRCARDYSCDLLAPGATSFLSATRFDCPDRQEFDREHKPRDS